MTELHEVRTLNKWLTRLRDEFGLRADVLLPRRGHRRRPPPRFILHRDGEEHPLLDLRALVADGPAPRREGDEDHPVQGPGRDGRRAALGDHHGPDAADPLQVQLDDVAAANDLFTTLMGDDVEPRREFIEKHALEVKNLDV